MTAVPSSPPAPVGQTGTSRTRRCVSREGAPRRARVPPINYRAGLSPCLTNLQETDITTIIQWRRYNSIRATLVAIDRNRWHPSEWVVAIVGMRDTAEKWQRSPWTPRLPHNYEPNHDRGKRPNGFVPSADLLGSVCFYIQRSGRARFGGPSFSACPARRCWFADLPGSMFTAHYFWLRTNRPGSAGTGSGAVGKPNQFLGCRLSRRRGCLTGSICSGPADARLVDGAFLGFDTLFRLGRLNNQVQHLSGRVLRWEPTTSI
jgi:hypothetical protein